MDLHENDLGPSAVHLAPTLVQLATLMSVISERLERLETKTYSTDRSEGTLISRLPWAFTPEERYPVKEPSKYTEFEKKYPPDRYGTEATENARVWKIYRDRANERDQDKIDGWSRTLDILLIFAGLFSAVATAFIIESYKLLQPDYVEYLALAFVATQTNGTVPPNPADFTAPSLARWTNGLWFVSLALALCVALFAILSKQWLENYVSRMRSHTASNRHWAWRHMFYSTGLDKWGLDVFVSALPVLLHLSLGLFFVGLIGFLWPISKTIATIIGAGSACVFGFYLAVGLTPLFVKDHPSATPLLRQIHKMYARTITGLRSTFMPHRALVPDFEMDSVPTAARWKSSARALQTKINSLLAAMAPVGFDDGGATHGAEPERDAAALYWMITELPAADEVDAALDCVGALPLRRYGAGGITEPEFDYEILRRDGVLVASLRRFFTLSSAGTMVDSQAVGQCLRTMLFLGISANATPNHADTYSTLDRWSKFKTNEAFLLSRCLMKWYLIPDEHAEIDWLTGLGEPAVCHPSTLALLIHAEKHLDLSELLLLYARGIPGFSTLPTLPQCVMRHTLGQILDSVERKIQAEEATNVRNGSSRLDRWVAFDQSYDVRCRAIHTWGYVLINVSELGISFFAKTAQAVLSRSVEELDKQEGLGARDLPAPDLWLWYFGTNNFLRRTWPATTLRSIGGILRTSCRWYWPPKCSAIMARLLFQCANLDGGQKDDFRKMAETLVQLATMQCSCHSVSDVLGREPSVDVALSKLSILSITVLSDHRGGSLTASPWRTACDILQPSLTRILDSALCLVTALLALHRRGVDISSQFEQLLGEDRGVQLICSGPNGGFALALHAKEISPKWWIATAQTLLQLPDGSWHDVLDVYPNPRQFVVKVQSAGKCRHCPPTVVFTDEAMTDAHTAVVNAVEMHHRHDTTQDAPGASILPLDAGNAMTDSAPADSYPTPPQGRRRSRLRTFELDISGPVASLPAGSEESSSTPGISAVARVAE